MTSDPFAVKSLSRFHLRRVFQTAVARLHEARARYSFDAYSIPTKNQPSWTPYTEYRRGETSVTPEQMGFLLGALKVATETSAGLFVEIGAFRGETTRVLSEHTDRTVVAIDPFIGYGGSAEDFEKFVLRTKRNGNVVHLRKTSGDAALSWTMGDVAMVFIDAFHDYVNVRHDIEMWGRKVGAGGVLAVHDVDNIEFAGTRRAVHEALQEGFTLLAHCKDLAVLQKV